MLLQQIVADLRCDGSSGGDPPFRNEKIFPDSVLSGGLEACQREVVDRSSYLLRGDGRDQVGVREIHGEGAGIKDEKRRREKNDIYTIHPQGSLKAEEVEPCEPQKQGRNDT